MDLDRLARESNYEALGVAELQETIDATWLRLEPLVGRERRLVFNEELVVMVVARQNLLKKAKLPAKATVEIHYGRPRPGAVFATCERTGDRVGPIWGTHERSVKRALMTLTRECSCGTKFHEESSTGTA